VTGRSSPRTVEFPLNSCYLPGRLHGQVDRFRIADDPEARRLHPRISAFPVKVASPQHLPCKPRFFDVPSLSSRR